MLYVYGITRSGRGQPDAAGLGRPPRPVRLIESGPVAAAVSELPEDYLVEEADARAHLHVLIGLLADGPVLPVRLGTLAPDADIVRSEVLDSAAPELVARLDAVDGLVELHVDADDDETQSIAEIAQSTGLAAQPGADLAARIEFGEEIAARLVDYRRQLADEIVSELRPLAVRDTPRSTVVTAEDPPVRWAFLVGQDDLPRFDAAIVQVRTRYPELAIRYAGPLPPSHFIDDQQEPLSTDIATDTFQATGAWGWDTGPTH